jgi:hypothetical protein
MDTPARNSIDTSTASPRPVTIHAPQERRCVSQEDLQQSVNTTALYQTVSPAIAYAGSVTAPLAADPPIHPATPEHQPVAPYGSEPSQCVVGPNTISLGRREAVSDDSRGDEFISIWAVGEHCK